MTRARILVIDDDPLFRSLIVSLLRRDFVVSVAGDGSEGFYKALEHPPDLAVIDMQMSGWDGLTTLRAFRAHPAFNRLKTVILTSDGNQESVLAAMRHGADDYLIKTSFSKDELSQKLSRLLAVKGARAEAPESDLALDVTEHFAAEQTLPELVARPQSAKPRRAPISGEDAEARLQEMIDAWE